MTQEKTEPRYGLMRQNEYAVMYEFEQGFWWYRALHRMVLRMLERETRGMDPAAVTLIDCGCGTGGMLQQVRERYPRSVGFDFSGDAVAFCRERGLTDVAQASITDFDFGEAAFDIALSLDVLCNLDLEQFGAALARIHRSLKPGGAFIFNLPAFDSLQSEHDHAVGVFRRFRRHRLRRDLERAGFAVEWINYRIVYPFPLLALIRGLKKLKKPSRETAQSDLKPVPKLLNTLLTVTTDLENRIAGWLPMPFGLSVFGIVRKK